MLGLPATTMRSRFACKSRTTEFAHPTGSEPLILGRRRPGGASHVLAVAGPSHLALAGDVLDSDRVARDATVAPRTTAEVLLAKGIPQRCLLTKLCNSRSVGSLAAERSYKAARGVSSDGEHAPSR